MADGIVIYADGERDRRGSDLTFFSVLLTSLWLSTRMTATSGLVTGGISSSDSKCEACRCSKAVVELGNGSFMGQTPKLGFSSRSHVRVSMDRKGPVEFRAALMDDGDDGVTDERYADRQVGEHEVDVERHGQ